MQRRSKVVEEHSELGPGLDEITGSYCVDLCRILRAPSTIVIERLEADYITGRFRRQSGVSPKHGCTRLQRLPVW
jgi:hypothetical protein